MLLGTSGPGKLFARIFCANNTELAGRSPLGHVYQRLTKGAMSEKKPFLSPGKRLRESWRSGPVAIPGAFNALTARLIERLGFQAVYLSGGALSAASGVPDVGLLSLTEFTDEARRIAMATSLPLLCDADTGF